MYVFALNNVKLAIDALRNNKIIYRWIQQGCNFNFKKVQCSADLATVNIAKMPI